MVGFKKIIENMVRHEVGEFVDKQSGEYSTVTSVSFDLDKKVGNPVFHACVEVNRRDYFIVGYVTDWGHVVMCSLRFERVIDGKEHEEFFPGPFMNDFKFDR